MTGNRLRVEPGALDGFADALDGLSGEADKARDYVGEYVLAVDGGCVYQRAVTTVSRIRTELLAVMRQQSSLCEQSATAIRESAAEYRGTDHDNASSIENAGNGSGS